MKKKSISTKLVAEFAILVAVIALVLTLVGINIAKRNLLSQQENAITTDTMIMVDQIEQKLNGNLDNLEVLSRNPIFTSADTSFEEKCTAASVEADAGVYYTILYTLPDGSTILPKNGMVLNLNDTHDDAFQTTMATGERCYKATRTINGTTLMVTNAVPVKDDQGEVTGVLVGTVLISDFAELLGDQIEAFIIDPAGDFIGHTKAAHFYKDEADQYVWEDDGAKLRVADGDNGVNISVNPLTYQNTDPSYAGLATLVQTMLDNTSGIVENYVSRETGEKQYVAYNTIPSTGWKVAYLVNASTIDSALRSMMVAQIVVALIILLIGLGVVYFLSKALVRPLEKASKDLDDIIDGIQSGNGDLTVRIPVKSNDEIGSIINGINHYTEVLQGVTLQIKEGAEELSASVDNVMTSIAAANNQATDNSAIMEELAASMEEVDATTTNIREYMEHVVESVGEIFEEAENGLSFAKEINARAEGLKQSSENSQQSNQKVISEIAETLKTSIENSKNVDKINDLTNDILSIASQTNLLALNASIEAARAGEAGRGFAVVADEIRHLADDSRETANNIQQISILVNEAVNELVANANSLLEYMSTDIAEDYTGMVATGEAYVGDASQISEIMSRLQEQTDSIKERIASALDLLTGTSQAVSESAEGVTMAAENTTELVSSISQIDSEMETNRGVTAALTAEIAKFKKI